MKKTKNVGKRIAIGTIILALFVAIMIIVLFNTWIRKGTKIAKQDIAVGEEDLKKAEEWIDTIIKPW
jgi:hypothetical protein